MALKSTLRALTVGAFLIGSAAVVQGAGGEWTKLADWSSDGLKARSGNQLMVLAGSMKVATPTMWIDPGPSFLGKEAFDTPVAWLVTGPFFFKEKAVDSARTATDRFHDPGPAVSYCLPEPAPASICSFCLGGLIPPGICQLFATRGMEPPSGLEEQAPATRAEGDRRTAGFQFSTRRGSFRIEMTAGDPKWTNAVKRDIAQSGQDVPPGPIERPAP